jgi:hypothetical protein
MLDELWLELAKYYSQTQRLDWIVGGQIGMAVAAELAQQQQF